MSYPNFKAAAADRRPLFQVTLQEKLAYLTAGLGKDLIYWLITAFYLFYLAADGRCEASFILTLFILGRVFDLLTDPLIGLLVDMTHGSFGKFKPWLMGGTLLSAAMTCLLFYDPGLPAAQFKVYAAVTFALWTLCYTMMDIPYWALIPSFSSEPRVREQMSATARLGTLLGAQLMLLAGTALVRSTPDSRALCAGFFHLALLAAGVFVLLQAILCLTLHDRSARCEGAPVRLRHAVRLILNNDELLIVLAITLLQQIAVGLANTAFFTYITRLDVSSAAMDAALLTAAAGQVLALLCLVPLIRVLGRRRLFICSALLMAAGYALLLLLRFAGADAKLLVTAYSLGSVGMALCCALTTVMLSDSVDYGEFKTGIRSEALLFAVQTLSAKVGLVAAYLLSGLTTAFLLLLPRPHRPRLEQIFSTRVLLLAAVVFSLLMLFLYLKSYRLQGAFFNNMLKTLEQLREPAAPHGRSAAGAQSGQEADSGAPAAEAKAEASGRHSAERAGNPERLHPTEVSGPAEFGSARSSQHAGQGSRERRSGSEILVRYSLDKSCIIRESSEGQTLPRLVDAMAFLLERLGSITSKDELCTAVLARHQLSSCAIAEGIAIAHARGPFAKRPCMALTVLDAPLTELTCPDGTACDIIFLIACPDDGVSHLSLLGRLSLILNEPGFADTLRSAGSRHEIYDRLLQCSLRLTKSTLN